MTTSTYRRSQLLDDEVVALERMLEIRAVEERIQDLFNDGLVRGSTHLCSGQEAVAVGIAMETRPTDHFACTYRGHGVALALGATPESVIAEILGRATGCSGGIGGSMHLCDMSVGLLPTFAIVGAGIPIAVGAALTANVRGTDSIAVAVFGDGATNIGAFHEATNLAAVWKLPVILVCENNLYGEYSRYDRTTPIHDLADRASSYLIPGYVVDGQDLSQVRSHIRGAVARARAGEGPTLLEMKTYRYSGHSRSDPATYRPPGELESWRQRDPIELHAAALVERKTLTSEDVHAMRSAVTTGVREAAERAIASPPPALSAMFEHVTATPPQSDEQS